MADSQQRDSNPDEPLDLSSTGKQCLENSTGEQCDSSSNKLEAASSTNIEKPAINATDPQTLTYGKHRLPINEASKHSLSRGIQPRKSKQILLPSARAESQVNNDHAEKASSLQISGSAVGSPFKKNISPQVVSQVNNAHPEEVSSSQTTGSTASSPSKINASPQAEPRVNNDQPEEASSLQASDIAAGLPYKGNTSAQVEFQVNIDHAKKASSSQAPESAARSLFPEKSPRSFRFSEEQLEILVEAYGKNKNPCYSTKTKLASELNVKYSQVHNWFYGRCKDLKKEASEPAAATPKPPPRKWTQRKLREQDLLEVEFKKNPYPTPKVQNEMSEKINLPTRKVVQWFKRRRKIEKKKRNQPLPEPTKQESDQDKRAN